MMQLYDCVFYGSVLFATSWEMWGFIKQHCINLSSQLCRINGEKSAEVLAELICLRFIEEVYLRIWEGPVTVYWEI